MEKRHFEAIAKTMRAIRPDRGNQYATRSVRVKGGAKYEQWTYTCRELARTLAQFNPRFNSDRFLAACGLGE